MKLRFFLTGVIFVFSGLVARGQVTEVLYQSFENGEVPRVSASPAANMNYSTAYHSTGSRSLEVSQSLEEDVELYLDTLDFTNDLTIRYITLEFDHICKVPQNSGSANKMGRIYFKRANQTTWTLAGASYYNRTEGGSANFNSLSAFNTNSYSDWEGNTPISNSMWKSERFDLNNVLNPGLGPEERKVQIKFVVLMSTLETASGKWMFDNIKVTASSEMMVKPTVKMACYPDEYYHPSSRGARIELNATTTLPTGIDPDSVYIVYRVGSDATEMRLPMSQVPGVADRYRARIPFWGYDTLMSFYCVVKDATGNHNEARFPKAEGSWQEYVCVRGVEQLGVETPGFVGTSSSSNFPFRGAADARNEWVFDSALLHNANYDVGAITALRFTTAAHTDNVTRPQVQIRMKNIPTNYQVDTSVYDHYPFTQSYMQIVYDSALTIPERNVGGTFTIPLQDSFFYAGKDILVQFIINGTEDVPATSVKTINIYPHKPTIWTRSGAAQQGADAFAITTADRTSSMRPAMVMTERKNQPLLYDMGFVTDTASAEYGLVTPNHDVPMTTDDHSVQVKLKNWGALTVDSIRISYSIDGGTPAYFDWSGSLAGGAVETVTIAQNVPLPAGFHTLRVWVEDSLSSGGVRYRDHEPYNDTIFSEFIVCEGAMHGVRRIGGTNADFNTVEEFLFALSRCGVDDSLVVKLAPGQYTPAIFPAFPGSSENNYVVFEPMSGRVTFYADVTVPAAVAREIINMEQVSNVRFRNIYFVRRTANGDTTVLESMAKIGMNSENCRFENCVFVDSVYNPVPTLRINSMINSGFGNGITIDGCTFRGAKIGVDLSGMAMDVRSQNNTVKNSLFYNQYECALNVQNQTNVVIEKNEMYDVLSNTSYVLLVSECYGNSRIMSNRIYTSHGAGAMGVSNAKGTSTQRFLIANNMVVGEDDGTASLMRSPLNIIQTDYADVVYNSVKMRATSRSNIAAATFGGGTLTNSRFLNNIVVSLDNQNYAFNYIPGSATSNEVGHNVYYSMGTTMNRKGSSRAFDMTEWRVLEPADSLSVKLNPNFLNGSLVDLRTFNRQVKGIGIPLASVTTDIYDSVRGDSATCPGAYEFMSLGYDFEPEALVNPPLETCYMPAQTELVLKIRNNGTGVYTGSGLTVTYRVNNNPVQMVQVTDTIPADDTATVHTGAMLSLPANGFNDATYTIRVWTTYAADPNATNDTNVFTVVSKYHPAAPADVNMQIPYATEATITPTTGVNMWSVYMNTSAPQRPSTLYWYHDTLDAEPFFIGPSLTTDTLRQDTVFYFRQRRAQPIVRITQLEIKRGGSGTNATTGETPNAPYWLNSGRKIALQLTNIGDERACLYGDTIVTVSPTGTLNNKAYRFNDSIYIEPGQSLILQYASGNSVSPANTIHTGTAGGLNSLTVTHDKNIAFLYKRNGVIEDAVVLNTVADHNAPSYVWMGGGVSMSGNNTSAGIVRVAFAGNQNDWRIATNDNPMMLNTIDPSWIRYTDNGCEGDFAAANVTMIAPPSADLDVSNIQLPAVSCGLGLEPVTVTVRNYGLNPVSNFVMNYSTGSDTVSDTVTTALANSAVMNYTFSTPLNLAFPHDSTVTVRVWVDAVEGDPIHANDTCSVTVMSMFTPEAPDTIPTRIVNYGERDTITYIPASGLLPIWYDYNGNAVDTGYTHVTDILYSGGTMGVSQMVYSYHWGQIGNGTTLNGNTAFPSPYQPGNKYAKQQYIYSASELRSMGLEAGYIDSIAFDLQQFAGNNPPASYSFNDYYVSMGLTEDTVFANTSDWKNTRVVFHRSPFVVNATDCNNWVPLRFDTPFYWDGESSVVVQLVHHIDPKGSGAKSAYTTKANTTLHKNSDSDLSPNTMGYVGTGTRGGNRPNIRMYSSIYGCESSVTPYQVQMENIPSVDVAILWPDGMDTIDYNSCDTTSFYVNLRNQGADTTGAVKVYYTFDHFATDSVSIANRIPSGATEQTLLFSHKMAPGRHTLLAVVAALGDDIHTNDTIRSSFEVRFCGGTYTIAPTGGDYQSFGEAIDTLNAVGVEGPVVFNVGDATYTEQVILNNIPGSSETNTISFVGTGDNVLLTTSTSQNGNYVFFLDSASNVTLKKIRIEARPTANNVNYANALVMQKSTNITIDSCTIRVKGTINNANASCVVLGENVNGLTFMNNVVDSGFYSIKSNGVDARYNNIVIYNNALTGFWKMGVNLRGVTNLNIGSNRITSGVATAGRALRGLYLADVTGDFYVEKNHIYLLDNKTGGKMGIQLENIGCLTSNPGYVINNMISGTGTGVADLSGGLKPAGIWIDSASSNINVYYNTVRLECGNVTPTTTFNENSYAFFTGATVSNINVMNNIFSNFAKGYVYYVTELNTVTLSNFNAYYTESERPFFWKQLRNNISELQNANNDDANSVFDRPFFIGNNDLHLVMTNFVSLAQYITDVADDIDGNIRNQIPAPTLGAHEMEVCTHDLSIIEILSPTVPADTNFSYPNKLPPNIEGDSVWVKVRFNNNGRSLETNVQWYVYLEGYEDVTRTPNRNLGTFNPSQMKIDSVLMSTELGIINRQKIRVVLVGGTNDCSPDNNEQEGEVFLAPAYDFRAMGTAVLPSLPVDGCNRQNSILQLTVKNDGFKDIPAGEPVKISFAPQITSPSSITIPTMPSVVEEIVPLPGNLLCGQTMPLTMTIPTNLYPTGTYTDITIRLKGWCHHNLDVSPENDTIQGSTVQSYYTPAKPEKHDTILPYGTWGEVTSAQINNRPVRWYRDTNDEPFYSPSQYAASCRWSNTPQYFHDSTYFINCLSQRGCPSEFEAVTVYVANRIQNDMAIKEVLAPLGNRVYMENDTVRIVISNYGTATQANFPITYELKKGNTVEQTVTEMCAASIPAGQDYTFTFDQLLQLTSPRRAQDYTLNIWTDLSTDGTRRNDTLRTAYEFHSLAENTYAPQGSGSPSFDITRVSFNEIDFVLPPLGRGLTDLVTRHDTIPLDMTDYPVLHVTRGTVDSLLVQVTPLDATQQNGRCKIWAYIDFNRDGAFSSDEKVVNGDAFYDNTLFGSLVTISENASYGYMRMRISVGSYNDFNNDTVSPPGGCIPSNKNGHTMDFMLFVDAETVTNDIAVTQIVSPRDYLIRDDSPKVVRFRIANKGSEAISQPVFHYSFEGSAGTDHGTVTYDGTLQPGTSAVVSLPAHVFNLGVTTLTVTYDDELDTNYVNNTLECEYNRFHVITLILDDDFEGENIWYAPKGYNEYSRNLWERGTPTKIKLNAAYSDSNAWVTDLHNNIQTGNRGNVSYLYSPIINISQVKADTLSFYLRRNLTTGSAFWVEFYNFDNKWVKLDWNEADHWYTDTIGRVFDGNTSGNTYDYFWLPCNGSRISGDFPENLQFRLVYSTSTTVSSFGEGCAVDDFHIGRAPIHYDAGVVAVTYPTAPSYGETIIPEVLVHNYGTDTINEIVIGYTHYGTYMPKLSTVSCSIAPGEEDTLVLTSPFLVTSDFPDTFNITAFTKLDGDIYRDNDTVTQVFPLSPLANDISAHAFLYPLNNVIAGDTNVQVTMRIRNFGYNPIYHATASYLINGDDRVDEEIDFVELKGEPLQTMEYYNYTFHQKIRANMGMMKITGIIKSENNDYIYNDTITKRVQGVSSVSDVAAASVIVDTSAFTEVRFQLIIENRGARAVNGFEVGFYIDNDTSTMYRETYWRSQPLPALTTGYHMFDTVLPRRPSGYNLVTAFVHMDSGDNDTSNDTTTTISGYYLDIEPLKVIVEETAQPDCRVFMELRNNGNLTLREEAPLQLKAVINGTTIRTVAPRRIEPGQTVRMKFQSNNGTEIRIAKSPTRTYTGTGELTLGSDVYPDNNTTNVVVVMNHVEGVPTVECSLLELEQNYPNPFTGRTTIPFSLPEDATVRFFIVDAMGHVVNSFSRHYEAGEQSITVDMDSYASGIYYYGIEVNGERRMKKMILR